MRVPDVVASRTPDGQFGVSLLHGDNAVVVVVNSGEGLAELIDWSLSPQAAEAIRTAIQTPIEVNL